LKVTIGNTEIGDQSPVYFIADIASNHGGDLSLAKELIHACKESRVNAVKMQNFEAKSIVSDYGFKNMSGVNTHQSRWEKSVFESYKAASIPLSWTLELKELSEKLGMDYFTSPYSLELIKAVSPYVSAFKLGSGDITWHEEIEAMAKEGKPLIIATGASDMDEVDAAMNVAQSHTQDIILMQCNTNYTAYNGEPEAATRKRFENINLKVLKTYSEYYPDVPLGLSDHTHGSLTVLAAVGLFGCSAVEKHFTLDSSQPGQDHPFSMMPAEWLRMVEQTDDLKSNLQTGLNYDERFSITKSCVDQPEYFDLIIGDGVKEVQKNERETVIVQRRAIRAARDLKAGSKIKREDLVVLRPCPTGALRPFEFSQIIGKELKVDILAGQCIYKIEI
jgi:N-acetylneuraminate synthase